MRSDQGRSAVPTIPADQVKNLVPKWSLMLKFSMVLTMAMLVTILALGTVLFFRFRDELFEDIKRRGALGVTTLSTLGSEILESRNRHSDDLASLHPETGQFGIPDTRNGEVKEVKRKLKETVEKLTAAKDEGEEASTGRLSRVLGYMGKVDPDQIEVLDAQVTAWGAGGKSYRVVSAKSHRRVQFLVREGSVGQPLKLRKREGEAVVRDIEVTKGYYSPKAGREISAFRFSRAILDSRGKPVGEAYLTLSAKGVSEVSGRMKPFLVLSCAISLVAGICLSFVLAALVNLPLKQLLQDVQIVADGRLDHRALVRSSDEVGVLARAFNHMTQSLKEAHRNEIENEVMRRDLKIAQEVQAHLVPQEMPELPGLDLTAKYEPAREVGGDAFDLIPLPGDRLGVVIADVAGKGVPGALYMAMTRIAFRVSALYAKSPHEIVTMVHDLMAPELTKGRFITAVYLEIDPRAGQVSACRLGHDPIIHFRGETKEIESYTPTGAAIGILPSDVFRTKVEVAKFALEPGDRVLLYTDGITEAANPNDEEFGTDRLDEFIRQNAALTSDQFVDGLIQEVKMFAEDKPMQDDLTVVSIGLPVAASAEAEKAEEAEPGEDSRA